jgi:hypothetical protein
VPTCRPGDWIKRREFITLLGGAATGMAARGARAAGDDAGIGFINGGSSKAYARPLSSFLRPRREVIE